ncbi:peroxisomal membrane protein PEX14-like [Watersipora subatra]|uniref:peroxisomal membrane protein PEX14-like n=1 Tax=Watersipora subatra TaxID=2589382 RepID=UPI00355B1C0A
MSVKADDSPVSTDKRSSNESISNKLVTDETGKDIVPFPRESLISTATKFLQSSAVANRSLKDKQSFLQKKGLTTQEIDEAISRSQSLLPAQANGFVPYKSENRVRNWSLFAILFGGVIYSCYRFCKDYLVPFLAAEKSETENIASRLTENTTALAEFGNKIEQLQQTCETNTQKIDQLQTSARVGSSGDIKDLKDELLSLKRLLLSRHQFPEAPNIKPVIPAWQLEEKPSSNTVRDSSTSEQPDMSSTLSNGAATSTTDDVLTSSVSSDPTAVSTCADATPDPPVNTANIDAPEDITSNATSSDKADDDKAAGGADDMSS